MDEKVSDFDNVFILFLKMWQKSCSRLGAKHNYFEEIFLNVFLIQYKQDWNKIIVTKNVVFLPIMDIKSGKSDVNGWKEKLCFLATLF